MEIRLYIETHVQPPLHTNVQPYPEIPRPSLVLQERQVKTMLRFLTTLPGAVQRLLL